MIVSLRDRFIHWLMDNLLTFILAGGMASMLYFSVNQAGWVKDSNPISLLLSFGLVIGWLLATSNWPGWVAVFYHVLLSLVVGIQSVASVLPPFWNVWKIPYGALVDGMHLRLVTFELRSSGWLAAIQHKGTIRDTGLFLLLLSFAGWWAAAWLMWWLVRRKQALPGILPLFALMAVNVHLSRQSRSTLLVFGILAILTIVRSAYTHARKDWIDRRVDYSNELGPEWGVGGTIAAMAIATFALVFSLVGTPDGWQMVSDMVQKSRQQMSDTANQLFAGVKPPPPNLDNKPVQPPPVISLPDMGEIGSPIAQGNEVILWARLSDPSPIPENIPGPPREVVQVPRHYWRSSIFGDYTGRGWQPVPLTADIIPSQAEPAATPGHYLLKQTFDIKAQHGDVLFSVNEPVKTNGDVVLRSTEVDGSKLVIGHVSTYEITSQANDVTANQLENAPTLYPDTIRAMYLQLPPGIPERVKQMAAEVVGAGSSPYQKAAKIQKFLRETYKYTLAVPSAPAGRDVVDYFLFDAPGGFCAYFSSAMTVMLRVEGVPARVAAGYAMGTFDPKLGMYRVPASASHAWVEVYFPGVGWVEFEPTPAYREFIYPEDLSARNGLQNQTDANQPPSPQKKSGQLLWLLVPLGLVIGLWGLYFWSKAERNRRTSPDLLALKLYFRVRRGFKLAGAPSGLTLTPAEYAEGILPDLIDYPRLADVLDLATRIYVQAAYSPRPPKVEDVIDGEWMWGQARQELIRLFLRMRLGRKSG